MRRVLASVLFGLLSWLAINVGVARLGDALGIVRYGETTILPDQYLGDGNRAVNGALAVAAFVGAGLLVAVVILWVSPRSASAAAVLGGAYLGLGAWATFAPGSVPSTGFAPAWGYAPMLAGLLSASTIRRPIRGSTATCLALAAGAWLATGIGLAWLTRATAVYQRGESLQLGEPDAVAGVAALVFLVAAGLAIGVLLPARGRIGLAAGLAYVSVSIFAMCAPGALMWDANAVEDALIAPALGYGLLLAVPLLVAALRPPVRRVSTDASTQCGPLRRSIG